MNDVNDTNGPEQVEPSLPENPPPPARHGYRKWILLAGAVLLTGIVIAGALWNFSPASQQKAEAEKAPARDIYYCPMHTNYKSDKPGNCPICSMKLVKLEGPATEQQNAAGSAPAGSSPTAAISGAPGSTDSMPSQSGGGAAGPDRIFIAPEQQQLIGVRTEAAGVMPLTREIRAAGKVTINEKQIAHIHTKVSGFIEDVFVNFVGQQVKRGDPLFTIYSPDLVSTQEEYLIALRSRGTLKESSFNWVSNASQDLVDAARQRLRLWDVTPEEIRSLEREGKVKRALTIYSPVSGTVTEREAFHHGRAVTPETDLYTIVDLSTVWIVGDVYQYELPFVKVGQTAQIELPYTPEERPLTGRITYISPFADPKTRTVQVRTELSNPGLGLKTDMFVNFKLNIDLGRWLVVPQDAVLDTGIEHYVFVDEGDGYFRPVPVKLGPRSENYFAVERGLKSGDRVVTAANFILDSESRLKGAFANMGRPSEREIKRAPTPASNLRIEVLEPRTAKVGQNPVRISVKDPSGKPITDAEVSINLFMPQMGSMPPMSSDAKLSHTGNGVYEGKIEFQMAWTWQTTITVRRGGQQIGSMRTNITAQ
ncbi:MAG TPA: efflux RND transporter periplasmic adaptor subunit [Acidobacteriota bacterium]|jgi:RND family efflux transporter MFP subunit